MSKSEKCLGICEHCAKKKPYKFLRVAVMKVLKESPRYHGDNVIEDLFWNVSQLVGASKDQNQKQLLRIAAAALREYAAQACDDGGLDGR